MQAITPHIALLYPKSESRLNNSGLSKDVYLQTKTRRSDYSHPKSLKPNPGRCHGGRRGQERRAHIQAARRGRVHESFGSRVEGLGV